MSKPLEFDISISAAKRRKKTGRSGMSGAVETSTRVCDHPDCKLNGKFRAPKSPDLLDQFHWFCEKHVREYNLRWDYYKGASTVDQHEDAPASPRPNEGWARHGINDPFEILGDKGTSRHAHPTAVGRFTAEERRALSILEADASWNMEQVKRQYKLLVKIYHPDQNGGDRSAEKRLQSVMWAWNQIKASKNFLR